MDKFNSIADFIKVREQCVFCNTPLRAHLTNYVGITGQGIPIINTQLKNDRFECSIKHTTPSFEVKADVSIFIEKNTLFFDNFTNGELPGIDEHLVRRAFEDMGPHFQLYCPSKKCGLGYFISSYPIKLSKVHSVSGMWHVEPFGLFIESIRVGNYVVSNSWDSNKTHIYSRKNAEAKPITVSMVDFTTMSKEKIITRIKTLVTFS